MKILTKQIPMVLMAAVAAFGLLPPSTAEASLPIFFDWKFTSGMTPAAPEDSSAASGAALAGIVPGEFAAGWMANNSILGPAQGIWDLGRRGTINLNNPAGFAGDASQSRVVTVKVTQYQDGAIYDQLAAVSMAGATLVNSNAVPAGSADLGSWKMEVTQWSLPAGSPGDAISIVSAYYGSLIDEVTVEVSSATVQPPQLSIRRVAPGNHIEISWPADAGSMVLQTTANILDPSSWTAVPDPVQLNGNVRSVTLEAVGVTRSYRLQQP